MLALFEGDELPFRLLDRERLLLLLLLLGRRRRLLLSWVRMLLLLRKRRAHPVHVVWPLRRLLRRRLRNAGLARLRRRSHRLGLGNGRRRRLLLLRLGHRLRRRLLLLLRRRRRRRWLRLVRSVHGLLLGLGLVHHLRVGGGVRIRVRSAAGLDARWPRCRRLSGVPTSSWRHFRRRDGDRCPGRGCRHVRHPSGLLLRNRVGGRVSARCSSRGHLRVLLHGHYVLLLLLLGLLLSQHHLPLLLLHPLQRQLPLVLQVLLLLFPHDLQLFLHLQLAQPLGLLGLTTATLTLLLPQRLQRSPRVLHLTRKENF